MIYSKLLQLTLKGKEKGEGQNIKGTIVVANCDKWLLIATSGC